jgi:hypothetical protein
VERNDTTSRERVLSDAEIAAFWPQLSAPLQLILLTGQRAALPDGRLLVAAQDPFLEVLEADGRPRWAHQAPTADFRNQADTFRVSPDGTIVDFGFEQGGKSPLRFDLRALKIVHEPPADQQSNPPKQGGLDVQHWRGEFSPTLAGKPLKLKQYEMSRSLGIHPDGSRFVLGTEWNLRAFDATGKELWARSAPGTVWGVNVSGNGRLLVAAYSDGTIRWHRMDDGRELLALFVLADQQNWAAWTPEGFYGATAGAFGVLQWQVNHGFDAAADTVAINAIQSLRRPDALRQHTSASEGVRDPSERIPERNRQARRAWAGAGLARWSIGRGGRIVGLRAL